MNATPPAPRRRRLWLRLAWLGLATAALFEVGLRVALFSTGPGGPLAPLRSAHLYAPRWSEEYFVLKHVLTDPSRRRPTRHDATLGWTHQRFDARSFAHAKEGALGDRRPVLLYGDSFAACVTQPSDCWQGLLEASDLADTHCLLNYGVGGYGFDQTCLLAEASVPRFAGRDPLVVVSLLVDADLDRAALGFFSWPKPEWRLDEDGSATPIGPVTEGGDAWVDEHGIAITSYGWRWLLHGSGLVPQSLVRSLSGEARHDERVRGLTRALLDRLTASLDGRDWFVLVFHGLKHVRDLEVGGDGADAEVVTSSGDASDEDDSNADDASALEDDWREAFLLDELDARGIRYVLSKPELRAAMQAQGGDPWALFVREGPSKRHYTAFGNRVVFESLRRGLEGAFDGPRAAR